MHRILDFKKVQGSFHHTYTKHSKCLYSTEVRFSNRTSKPERKDAPMLQPNNAQAPKRDFWEILNEAGVKSVNPNFKSVQNPPTSKSLFSFGSPPTKPATPTTKAQNEPTSAEQPQKDPPRTQKDYLDQPQGAKKGFWELFGDELPQMAPKGTVPKVLPDSLKLLRTTIPVISPPQLDKQEDVPDKWASVQGLNNSKKKEISIGAPISVRGLATLMGLSAIDVVKAMCKAGETFKEKNSHTPLDLDLLEITASHFGFSVVRVEYQMEDIKRKQVSDEEKLKFPKRPPIVAVMGHINHGKTTLLDRFRNTNVVADEAGSITQKIGAFETVTNSGAKITFLDTPGHEAFDKMRARGSKLVDIVLLVIAGDEGVMEQTIEAVKHIQAAKVGLIIAINKIDKHGADATKIKQQLLHHNIVTEEFGGDILAIPVSAATGENWEELEQAILMSADLQDLRADPNSSAEATTVESTVHKGYGPVASVVVRSGTLRVGDYFVNGRSWGRVRFLINNSDKLVEQAGPSCAVQVVGLKTLPEPGEDLLVVESEQEAKNIVAVRNEMHIVQQEKLKREAKKEVTEELPPRMEGAKEVLLMLKSDTNGGLEALEKELENIPYDEEVSVRVVQTAVGPITESDMIYCRASKAMLLGFNLPTNVKVHALAKQYGVPLVDGEVIYSVVNGLKAHLQTLLNPIVTIELIGTAKVAQIFSIKKGKSVTHIAGCVVEKGVLPRNSKIRVIRGGEPIAEGLKIHSLKRVKDDIAEAKSGTECGIKLHSFDDIKEGDILQSYSETSKPRLLGAKIPFNKTV